MKPGNRGYSRMSLSLSQRFDIGLLIEARDGPPPCPGAKPDQIGHGDTRPIVRPRELDLRVPGGFAQLKRMNLIWPTLSGAERHDWLEGLEVILPPRVDTETGLKLLPGGAVALRGSGPTLVCDPMETVTFSQAEVRHLRRVLRTRADVFTLLHTANGISIRPRVPGHLPPQAVTIVPNPAKLPIRVSFSGPIVIQWCLHGAVARPLVEVTGLLALAVSVAESPRVNDGHDAICPGPLFQSRMWQAMDAKDRWRLIGASLMGHVSDLVAGTVCDDLRRRLMERCASGENNLAARIAQALAVLPSCFALDPELFPGAPPPAWRHAMVQVRGSAHPRTLLGMDRLTDPVTVIRVLRDAMEYAEVMAFDKDGVTLPGGPAALHSDTALFLARTAGSRGRLAVVIPTPASPVDLYVLAENVAYMTGVRVVASAPSWGFCHRVGPGGEEAGNAGWFGMGAGLDEADGVLGDVEPGL